jgi:hypothetical protein
MGLSALVVEPTCYYNGLGGLHLGEIELDKVVATRTSYYTNYFDLVLSSCNCREIL